MRYRSTDRLCRGGAPMENLAHSASLHSLVKDAPSKPGTKHLALVFRADSRLRAKTLSGDPLYPPSNPGGASDTCAATMRHPTAGTRSQVWLCRPIRSPPWRWNVVFAVPKSRP